MQKQVNDHVTRVIAELHESYKDITSGLAKQAADAKLEARALHSQVLSLQEQNKNLIQEIESYNLGTPDEAPAEDPPVPGMPEENN